MIRRDPAAVRNCIALWEQFEREKHRLHPALREEARAKLEARISREIDPVSTGETLHLGLVGGDVPGLIRLSAFPRSDGEHRVSVILRQEPSVSYEWIDNEEVRRFITDENEKMEQEILYSARYSTNDILSRRSSFFVHVNNQLEYMLAHLYHRIGVIIKVNSIKQIKIGRGEMGNNIKNPSHFDRMCDFFDPDNCDNDMRNRFDIFGSVNRIRNTMIHGGNKLSLGYRSMEKEIDKEIDYMKERIDGNIIIEMRVFLEHLSSKCALRLQEKKQSGLKK